MVVECQPELVRLIGYMDCVEQVHATGQQNGTFDLRVPLHNLIGAFRTTADSIPARVPYLRAGDEEIASYHQRVGQHSGLRVGLCWFGNPDLPRDASRSVPFPLIQALVEKKGASFFSLQKRWDGVSENLVDWSLEFEDMACTAALIETLDLVISVDSAVAHLAGALGRPLWLLNRFDSCWRWLENRTDSPWYPTMTQFRQHRPGDWNDVLAEVSVALDSAIQAHAGSAGNTYAASAHSTQDSTE